MPSTKLDLYKANEHLCVGMSEWARVVSNAEVRAIIHKGLAGNKSSNFGPKPMSLGLFSSPGRDRYCFSF